LTADALCSLSATAEKSVVLQLSQQAASLLAAPAMQQPLSQKLQQLLAGRAEPLLTLQQLQYAVNCCSASAASEMYQRVLREQRGASRPSGQQLQQARASRMALMKAVAALVTLEPRNLKGLLLAAQASMNAALAEPQQVADGFLRCFREAQQQHSEFYAALAAHFASSYAAVNSHRIRPSTLREAVAAFQQAEPAVRRCRQLLPHMWVAPLLALLSQTQQLCSQLQQQLQQPGSISRESAAAAWQSWVAAAPGVAEQVAGCIKCSGCGSVAVALRRCGACRKAQYCRCLVGWWPGAWAGGRWVCCTDLPGAGHYHRLQLGIATACSQQHFSHH